MYGKCLLQNNGQLKSSYDVTNYCRKINWQLQVENDLPSTFERIHGIIVTKKRFERNCYVSGACVKPVKRNQVALHEKIANGNSRFKTRKN